MEAPAPSAHDALAALQRELASRQSVLHFAHSAVSTIVGLIIGGATFKLLWDLEAKPETEIFVIPAATFTGICLIYGVVRYFWGRRALKLELVRFAELQLLRRQLKLDDPSPLLPR